jgi:hypothetical protein
MGRRPPSTKLTRPTDAQLHKLLYRCLLVMQRTGGAWHNGQSEHRAQLLSCARAVARMLRHFAPPPSQDEDDGTT